MKNIKEPLVSVLVAVYNVDKYLSKCLESIINQTYINLEIIIVDDGSIDTSLSICKDYEKKDTRIKVISKKNEGLSSARNIAIECANGQYIYMTDSDDYLLPDMIKTLVTLLLNNKADIAVCDYYVNLIDKNRYEKKVNVMNSSEILPDLLLDRISSQVWNKIFSKEIIKSIRFPANMVAQDIGVMHLFFANANSVVFTNEKLYVYIANRNDNISNSNKLTISGSYHRAIHFHERYKFAERYFPNIAQDVLNISVHFFVTAYLKCIIVGNTEIPGKIRETLSIFKKQIFENSKLKLSDKFISYCIMSNKKYILLFISKVGKSILHKKYK